MDEIHTYYAPICNKLTSHTSANNVLDALRYSTLPEYLTIRAKRSFTKTVSADAKEVILRAAGLRTARGSDTVHAWEVELTAFASP